MMMRFLGMVVVCCLAARSIMAQELVFPPDIDTNFHWSDYGMLREVDLTGQKLRMTGPWIGPDKVLFESVLSYFEAATGARITYVGSTDFEKDLLDGVANGVVPDIAIVPQPGLAADLARRGVLFALRPDLTDWIRNNYAAGDSWADYATYPGPDGTPHLYAFPYKTEVKSLVWYLPDAFVRAGYQLPTTFEALMALGQQMIADGNTPWCIGIASGAATGWPGTDWIEDLMLRVNSPADYDDWVEGTLRFDDPKVIAAFNQFGQILSQPGAVVGGRSAVAKTDFRDSVQGLFSNPPQCFMHRQASFITSFFPADMAATEQVDVFLLPSFSGRADRPVLGAGTFFVRMTPNPAADALIDFLTMPLAHEIWMAQTGFSTPHLGANRHLYPDTLQRHIGEILAQATVFRFDGSDLMPAEVGVGAFWTGMVDFANGASAQDVTRKIQISRDTQHAGHTTTAVVSRNMRGR